jgi:hypothetical protein
MSMAGESTPSPHLIKGNGFADWCGSAPKGYDEQKAKLISSAPCPSAHAEPRSATGTASITPCRSTASTLYEAVALGLASIRGEEWVGAIAEGLNTVRVSVTNVPVEHWVRIQEFEAWLQREGRTPRERADRNRIREILGVNGSATK